jgi:hypothetical protein
MAEGVAGGQSIAGDSSRILASIIFGGNRVTAAVSWQKVTP